MKTIAVAFNGIDPKGNTDDVVGYDVNPMRSMMPY